VPAGLAQVWNRRELLPVVKTLRFVLLAAVAALAATALGTSHANAAARMPIGFFDDQSFRWSSDKVENLQRAADAGATVIHTQASWPAIAPTATTPCTASPTSMTSSRRQASTGFA
jgi:hypothetical protein